MKTSEKLTRFIDFFYIKPIAKIMPLQTFRYAVCGGSNLVFNWLIYALLYNFVIKTDFIDLGVVEMSRHIMAFVITFPITFLTGYWLQSRISFSGSPLKGSTQIFRYGLSVVGALLLNYLGLKLFVETCSIYAPVAQIIVSLITVVYSYIVQKHFTFRGSKV